MSLTMTDIDASNEADPNEEAGPETGASDETGLPDESDSELTARFERDAIPLLAAIFPASAFARVAAACLMQKRPRGYYDQYFFEGVFAFIFGPERLAAPETIVPTFAVLPQTGHLTSYRRGEGGRSVRLHVVGAKAKASHTHFDKGAVLLEIDGESVLIDRGQVRYDDLRSYTLKRSELHNVVTPVLAGGVYPQQAGVEEAVIPRGEGDERQLRAEIELGHVWRGVMKRYRRTLTAEDLASFTVRDEGELMNAGALSFHLQTRTPWKIAGHEARLAFASGELVLRAPWSDEIVQREDSIDFRLEPVWHLECRVREARAFGWETQFAICWR